MFPVSLEIQTYLDDYPTKVAFLAQQIRELLLDAVNEKVAPVYEKYRQGWDLIGYSVSNKEEILNPLGWIAGRLDQQKNDPFAEQAMAANAKEKHYFAFLQLAEDSVTVGFEYGYLLQVMPLRYGGESLLSGDTGQVKTIVFRKKGELKKRMLAELFVKGAELAQVPKSKHTDLYHHYSTNSQEESQEDENGSIDDRE
ncbi:MAG: hypothetical protein MPJ24_05390 [Pirellulaceae bacterium]|nr:hypothetical protein [Pirellulaceae bacterium]